MENNKTPLVLDENPTIQKAPPLIYAKMALILADIDAITKDRTNTQGQTFKYRGIDDIYNELHASFAKHQVFCTTEVLERAQIERQSKSGGALFYTVCRIRFTFWATDGSSVSSITVGEAMDSGDKSTNKAMAVAHKYCLLQAFLVPTEDEKDPDGQTHEVMPRQPRATKPAAIPPQQKQAAQQPSRPAHPAQPPQTDSRQPAAQNQQQYQPQQPHPSSTPPAQNQGSANFQPQPRQGYPTQPQLKKLFAVANQYGWRPSEIKEYMFKFYGIDSTSHLTLNQYNEFIQVMESMDFYQAMGISPEQPFDPGFQHSDPNDPANYQP